MRWFALLLLAVACSGDARQAPDCAEAFRGFYANGCLFVGADTGTPIPQNAVLARCEGLVGAVPARCGRERDAWLSCVRDSSAPRNGCNCSTEQMALLGCR